MAKIPTTDSIQELAAFWQQHDLTDFEDELEEVAEPVFRRAHVVGIPLTEAEHQAIRDAAVTGRERASRAPVRCSAKFDALPDLRPMRNQRAAELDDIVSRSTGSPRPPGATPTAGSLTRASSPF